MDDEKRRKLDSLIDSGNYAAARFYAEKLCADQGLDPKLGVDEGGAKKQYLASAARKKRMRVINGVYIVLLAAAVICAAALFIMNYGGSEPVSMPVGEPFGVIYAKYSFYPENGTPLTYTAVSSQFYGQPAPGINDALIDGWKTYAAPDGTLGTMINGVTRFGMKDVTDTFTGAVPGKSYVTLFTSTAINSVSPVRLFESDGTDAAEYYRSVWRERGDEFEPNSKALTIFCYPQRSEEFEMPYRYVFDGGNLTVSGGIAGNSSVIIPADQYNTLRYAIIAAFGDDMLDALSASAVKGAGKGRWFFTEICGVGTAGYTDGMGANDEYIRQKACTLISITDSMVFNAITSIDIAKTDSAGKREMFRVTFENGYAGKYFTLGRDENGELYEDRRFTPKQTVGSEGWIFKSVLSSYSLRGSMGGAGFTVTAYSGNKQFRSVFTGADDEYYNELYSDFYIPAIKALYGDTVEVSEAKND